MIQSLNITTLSSKFATLKQYVTPTPCKNNEKGNLFIVKQDNLKTMIFELAMVTTKPDPELVKNVMEFAGMREDWGKVGKRVMKDVQFYTNAKE